MHWGLSKMREGVQRTTWQCCWTWLSNVIAVSPWNCQTEGTEASGNMKKIQAAPCGWSFNDATFHILDPSGISLFKVLCDLVGYTFCGYFLTSLTSWLWLCQHQTVYHLISFGYIRHRRPTITHQHSQYRQPPRNTARSMPMHTATIAPTNQYQHINCPKNHLQQLSKIVHPPKNQASTTTIITSPTYGSYGSLPWQGLPGTSPGPGAWRPGAAAEGLAAAVLRVAGALSAAVASNNDAPIPRDATIATRDLTQRRGVVDPGW